MKNALLATIFVGLSACGPVPYGTKDKGEGNLDSGLEVVDDVLFGGVEITPGSVDMGEVYLNETATADVILHNLDDSAATVTMARIQDAGFEVTSTVDFPLGLDPDATAILTLEFTPTAIQRYLGVLSIGVAGEVGYAEVPVSGDGVAGSGQPSDDSGTTGTPGGGQLAASSSLVEFGEVATTTTATQALNLTNVGTGDVVITSITSSDAAFDIDRSLVSIPIILSPSEVANLTVTFTPLTHGLYGALLDIDNDGSESVLVSLNGIGGDTTTTTTPAALSVTTSDSSSDSLSLEPTFGFGCVANGSITLSNTGTESMDITGVTVNNDTLSSCGSFSRAWAGPLTLAGSESAIVAIEYIATGPCIEFPYLAFDQNVVHITTSEALNPDHVIELSAQVLFCG